MNYTLETNKLKIFWIWIWYNDLTRFCVLGGLPLIPVYFVLNYFNVSTENREFILVGAYFLLFLWGYLDNNYSNLRRIGLDEFRNKLNQ